MTSVPLLIILLALVTGLQQLHAKCTEYYSERYIYHICDDKMTFNESRRFCQQSHGSDLAVFHTKDDHDVIVAIISDYANKTKQADVMFFIGLYQRAGNDFFHPGSGELFWVSDPSRSINNDSATYWQAFREWIYNFDSLNFGLQSKETFTINSGGIVNAADSFFTGDPLKAAVMCQQKATPIDIKSSISTDKTLSLWVVTGIVGGCVLALVVIIVTVLLIRRKMIKDFQKVPTSEQSAS